MGVAPELLKGVSLQGKVVTGDALYSQRKLVQQIRDAGGHYLVVVKKNQLTLYQDIELLFAQPPEDEVFASAETQNRHGDRREIRRLWASTALRGYLDWPGVEQVCKVERISESKENRTEQVRYVITDLGTEVSPEDLMRHVRGHWGIENRLHYVRDVTFGEDASQVRKQAAPEVMAALRNVTIGILRKAGWQNISGKRASRLAAALRHNGWKKHSALELLGISTA